MANAWEAARTTFGNEPFANETFVSASSAPLHRFRCSSKPMSVESVDLRARTPRPRRKDSPAKQFVVEESTASETLSANTPSLTKIGDDELAGEGRAQFVFVWLTAWPKLHPSAPLPRSRAFRCRRHSKSKNFGPGVLCGPVKTRFGSDEVRCRKGCSVTLLFAFEVL